MTESPSGHTPAEVRADVVVLGGGIVGLATSVSLAQEGASVALVAVDRPGAAARAAAGLLVPHYSGEGTDSRVAQFLRAGRDLYASYVGWAAERSGMSIPFQASGAIEIARSPDEHDALLRDAPHDAEPLSDMDVARLEPALATTSGGLFYPKDGAVDNARLTDALAAIAATTTKVRRVGDAAASLELRRDSATITCSSGQRVQGGRVVLAAGAWSAGLHGLPHDVPVRPIRGQICTVRGTPLRHVVLAADVYMVTRGGDRTLVGSTMEDVGFDAQTTPAAIAKLREAAASTCPSLAGASLVDAWAGLRPVTPDLLPILGPDPSFPTLVYACGHSRNGILLAPITAAATTALILGHPSPWDISPFGVDRFEGGR